MPKPSIIPKRAHGAGDVPGRTLAATLLAFAGQDGAASVERVPRTVQNFNLVALGVELDCADAVQAKAIDRPHRHLELEKLEALLTLEALHQRGPLMDNSDARDIGDP